MNHTLLYSEVKPFNTGYLQVSDLHTLYFEEFGNPEGEPVVFVHGGPGAGAEDRYRPYFDPEYYRIVVFDQRGSGRSIPYAETRENTTWDLVSDMEKLRERLKIESWITFGDSWGSALSLCYAIKHTDRVKGMVLRGVFLCRKSEINWLYKEGASHIFADKWEEFIAPIPEDERDDLIHAYYKRLTGDDEGVRIKASKAWSIWEGSLMKLIPDEDLIDDFGDPQFAVALAKIECHYFKNDMFVDSDNYILENVHKLKHIPCALVQGRYDVVSPMRSAWELHKNWPLSEIRIVKDCGHSVREEGMVRELVSIMEEFKVL